MEPGKFQKFETLKKNNLIFLKETFLLTLLYFFVRIQPTNKF
jgi:hypothetical protein